MRTKTKLRVFVSVPDDRHLDARRKALKRAIVRFIAKQDFDVVGFEPEQFGAGRRKNLQSWTVEKANNRIRQCDAALILALARMHVRKVAPTNGKAGKVRASAFLLPTAYNHLEGALAIAQQLPLLILSEENMDRTGIFSSGIKPATIPTYADPF